MILVLMRCKLSTHAEHECKVRGLISEEIGKALPELGTEDVGRRRDGLHPAFARPLCVKLL